MEELFSLGVSFDDMKCILEQNPSIFNISRDLILEKINILRCINCSDRNIKNIVVSNPEYLERDNMDLLKLFKYLSDVGFTLLNLLFDSNPYFLNYDVFEIKNYIEQRVNNGFDLEDVIDEIESNPYIIDEC